MKALSRLLVVMVLPAMPLLLLGCGEDKTIELRYERPAEIEVPASIQRIGIAEFEGATPEDRRWGSVASDRLAARLDENNRKYQRYQLVDRKNIEAILNEQDLQLAVSDAATAGQVGQLAGVEAMIYGRVKVVMREEHTTRTTVDVIHQTTKQVPYVKRYCMASVTFTMDHVATGRTIATISEMREFDSDDKSKNSAPAAITSAMGLPGGSSAPANEQTVMGLIDECVQAFVGKISAHDIVVSAKLKGGKSEAVKTGNTLAVAGEYAEALESYRKGLEEKADDHEAAYNAGLMCEALGQLAEAEQYYDQAFKGKARPEYVQARRRVRAESGE